MVANNNVDEGFNHKGLADTVKQSDLAHEPEVGSADDIELDPAKIKKIVRKYDMYVLPCLIVMYFMNYLDRQNVAAARLKGLQADLNITGLQYSNVINLFFVTYVGCQIPANYVLAFVTKPTWYICTMMCLWGLVSLLVAEVQNYAQLLAVRLILGVFEAVFYPGALFTLSKFYTRSELALRSAFFYGAALVASAFGSLFAAGVIAAVGPVLHGKAGWRYLFYIEGAMTIGLALIILFILPNYPSDAWFLTPEQRLIAVRRLTLDVGVVDENDPNEKWWQPLKQAFADPVIYLLGLTWWLFTAGLAFNSYSPTLTQSLGIGGSTISLLLTAPPYIYALILALVNGWHSDRTRERSWHVIVPLLPAIVGCIIPLATTQKAARFVGIFLMTGGYAGYPIILGWVQVSFPGKPKRRAAAIGFLSAFANTANIAGGYFFVSSKYGPTYRVSFGLVLAMFAAAIVAALTTRFYLIWRNKQLDRAETELIQNLGGHDKITEDTAQVTGLSTTKAAALAAGFRYFT